MCSDIRFAIVGTNFISDRFMEALADLGSARAVAVYSRKEETGRAFADKYGILEVFDDFERLLSDTSANAVYIASPTFCHEEQSCLAMLAGKHVLCEKMMSAELSGFVIMRETSERTDRILLEAMRPAHDPAYAAIKDAMARLGKIRRASLEFCQYSSRYDKFKLGIMSNAFDPHLKNSALADIGIYPLHTALMLFGEPDSVTAQSVFLDNGFEGSGVITMSYPEMLATVTYSKISDSVNPSVIEGELGSLTVNKISAPTEVILHLRGEKPEIIEITKVPNNMIYEIRAFCDMIHGKSDPRPYLETTYQAQKIVDFVYKTSHISDKF